MEVSPPTLEIAPAGTATYQAIRGVPVEQRRDLARAWLRHAGRPEPAFATWDETIMDLYGA